MDIDLIFKIAAVGIIVSILNQVLVRSGREEQATMTTLAGLVVVLLIVVQKIAPVRAGQKPVPVLMAEILQITAVGILTAVFGGCCGSITRNRRSCWRSAAAC